MPYRLHSPSFCGRIDRAFSRPESLVAKEHSYDVSPLFGRLPIVLLGFGLTVLGSGCDMLSEPEPAKYLRDVARSGNALADSLATVHDAPSARAAAPQIDAHCGRMVDLLNRLPELRQKYATTQVSKASMDAVMSECRQARSRMETQFERVHQLPGLPLEFWSVVRRRSYEILVATLSFSPHPVDPTMRQAMEDVKDLISQHGAERVVLVSFRVLPESCREEVLGKLQAAVPAARCIHYSDGTATDVFLGPVDDFQSFTAAIDFGTINFQDEGQRRLEVSVDFPKLSHAAGRRNPFGPPLPHQGGGATPEAQADAEARLAEAKKRAEEQFKQAEEERNRRTRGTGSRPARLLRPDGLAAGWRRPFPPQTGDRRAAGGRPRQVAAEARKQIARAFKDLATGDQYVFEHDKAVRGLVRWAGKYSVPTLLDLLSSDDHRSHGEVYKALGELKDPRAAVPVALKLGDFFEFGESPHVSSRDGRGGRRRRDDHGPYQGRQDLSGRGPTPGRDRHEEEHRRSSQRAAQRQSPGPPRLAGIHRPDSRPPAGRRREGRQVMDFATNGIVVIHLAQVCRVATL